MKTHSRAPFPWKDVLADTILALASTFVAAFWTVVLASYLGPQYCLVIFNDHVIGGTQDQFTAIVVGTVFGATSVFLVRQIRIRVIEWRRERGDCSLRVLPL